MSSNPQFPPDSPFTPYRVPKFSASEILVRADDVARVEQALQTTYRGVLIRKRETSMGIVRLEIAGAPSFDVEQAVDTIRASFGDDKPDLSPVHTVTVGTPNVVGNADELPKAARDGLPDRVADAAAGEGVTVAIIDTGVQAHPWLEGGIVAPPGEDERQVTIRYATADATQDVLGPQAGHGVFLAGLILQQAPAATIRVFRTANSFGESDIDDVAEAIGRAQDAGADVINLSLGCFTRNSRPPWTLRNALEALEERIAVVASAGNSSLSTPFWPAAFPRVTAVGALTSDGTAFRLAEYTNRGPWVKVYVPATAVLSTYISFSGVAVYHDVRTGDLTQKGVSYDRWATWSGTSMAAAIWSGALARAISGRGGSGDSPDSVAKALRGDSTGGGFDFVHLVDVPSDSASGPVRGFAVVPPLARAPVPSAS